MADTKILSVSLKDYKKEIDDLKGSLLGLEKGSEEYKQVLGELRDKQDKLNQVMADTKKGADAAEGSYNALVQEMAQLRQEWKATNDEATRNELGKQIEAINSQLKEFDASIGNHQRNVGDYAIAGQSMKSTLKEMQAEMANMLANGVKPTDAAFVELAQKAGKMKDALADAKTVVGQFANDTKTMATVLDVAKTGVAGFGAFKGAMAALGVQSESLEQTMTKLGGVMTLLNSLQTIQTALIDTASPTYQLFHSILESIGLAETTKTAATEADTVTTEANTVAEGLNTASKAGNTEATEANAVATGELGTAMEAEATSTGYATVATNLFKKALIATGIGAIIVLIGALIANWDKLSNAINKALGITLNYKGANDKLNESIKESNNKTDNQIKLMRAQGASEAQIIAYKIKRKNAQIAETKAKIADIEAQIKQTKESSRWYKVVSKVVDALALNLQSCFSGVLWVMDKIFKTDWAPAFNKMMNGFKSKVVDFATGIDGAEEEVTELKKTLKTLEQEKVDLSFDLKAENISSAREAAEKASKERAAQAKKDVTEAKKNAEKVAKDREKAEEEARKKGEEQEKAYQERLQKEREEAFAKQLASYDIAIASAKELNTQEESRFDLQEKLNDAYGKTTEYEANTRVLRKLKLQEQNLNEILDLYKQYIADLKMDEKEQQELDKLRSQKTWTDKEKKRLDELEKKEKDITTKRTQYETEAHKIVSQLSTNLTNQEIENAKISTNKRKEYWDKLLKDMQASAKEEIEKIDFNFAQIQVGIKPTLDLDAIQNEVNGMLSFDGYKVNQPILDVDLRLYGDAARGISGLSDATEEFYRKYHITTEDILDDNKDLKESYLEALDLATRTGDSTKLLEEQEKVRKIQIEKLSQGYDAMSTIEENYFQEMWTRRKEYYDGSLGLEIAYQQELHNARINGYNKQKEALTQKIEEERKALEDNNNEDVKQAIENEEKLTKIYQNKLNYVTTIENQIADIKTKLATETDEATRASLDKQLKVDEAEVNRFKPIVEKAKQQMEDAQNALLEASQGASAQLKADEQALANTQMEQAKETADFIIAQQDRINKKRKEDKKSHKQWVQDNIKSTLQLLNSTADMMGAIGDIMEENIDRKVEDGKISEKEAEDEFDRVKKVQLAELWISTLASAAGAFLQDMKSYPSPYNAIIAGIDFATALATGVAQTKKIKSQTYDGASSSGGSGTADIASVSVSPLLNEATDYQQMTALSTEQMANNTQDTKVYILQSDLEKSSKQVSVRQSSTTF